MAGVNNEENYLPDLGLGRKTYSKEQVSEFLLFHDRQGTKKAYLAEIVELAYGGRQRTELRDSGCGRGPRRPSSTLWACHSSPLYRIREPLAMSILSLMFIWGMVRLVVTIIMRASGVQGDQDAVPGIL